MKLPIIIAALVGVALVTGAWNKTVIRYARKVGKILSPLTRLSFTMSRLSEQEKDFIARLWLLWIGSLLLIAVVLGIVLKVGG